MHWKTFFVKLKREEGRLECNTRNMRFYRTNLCKLDMKKEKAIESNKRVLDTNVYFFFLIYGGASILTSNEKCNTCLER